MVLSDCFPDLGFVVYAGECSVGVDRGTLPVGHAHAKGTFDGILGDLPLHDWMEISVTPLDSHPSDPG